MSLDLLPSETEIVGSWIVEEETVRGDSNERRIEWLLANSLKRVSSDRSGWEILYRDRHDGRLWELTFPHGALQGGGPRRIAYLTDVNARTKYGFSAIQESDLTSEDVFDIGNQLIKVDRQLTRAAYASIDSAWSDQCECTPCRNFRPQRKTAFPPSFLELLTRLGIDPTKESEVYGCYPMPSGKRQYGGWFFFCGVLTQQGEGEVTNDGISFHVLGPGNMPAPGAVFEPNPLALNFTIELPWILLDENPDDLYGPTVKETEQRNV